MGVHKVEESAHADPVTHNVRRANVERRVHRVNGAKERLEGAVRMAIGILIEIDNRVLADLCRHLTGCPEGRTARDCDGGRGRLNPVVGGEVPDVGDGSLSYFRRCGLEIGVRDHGDDGGVPSARARGPTARLGVDGRVRACKARSCRAGTRGLRSRIYHALYGPLRRKMTAYVAGHSARDFLLVSEAGQQCGKTQT